MTESELAWIAGLFEGEGCFNFVKKSKKKRLAIRMTDFDILKRLHYLTPGSCLTGPYSDKRGRRKPIWTWQLNRAKELYDLVLALRPWMGERRGAKMDEYLVTVEGKISHV